MLTHLLRDGIESRFQFPSVTMIEFNHRDAIDTKCNWSFSFSPVSSSPFPSVSTSSFCPCVCVSIPPEKGNAVRRRLLIRILGVFHGRGHQEVTRLTPIDPSRTVSVRTQPCCCQPRVSTMLAYTRSGVRLSMQTTGYKSLHTSHCAGFGTRRVHPMQGSSVLKTFDLPEGS